MVAIKESDIRPYGTCKNCVGERSAIKSMSRGQKIHDTYVMIVDTLVIHATSVPIFIGSNSRFDIRWNRFSVMLNKENLLVEPIYHLRSSYIH